ncbi:hypothetical protein, partial [Corynebacterium diphtheriae]|uniref:hypothetical protein n=1 Tax=Corynebacterium diphtheriae TaxID=1717 RepID=UPI0010547A5A
SVPENNIAEVKQKPFTPPTVSPTELTTYIGTPPRESDTQPDVDHLLVVQGIKAKISDLTHLFHKP